MKVLIESFPCVTPINQSFFAEVEKLTGWDLHIVGPSNWKSGYGRRLGLERWAEFEGDLTSIPVLLSGNIPLHVYRSTFIRLLRRVQPDVIYAQHEAYAASTAQVFLANYFSLRKPIGFYSSQNVMKRYPPPFRQLERFVYRQADFAISITQEVLDVLREKGYEGPASIIPLGLDPRLYRPDERVDAAQFRQSPNDVVIGFVGRIVELKGLSTLLRALHRIVDLPWRLVLVGTGPYEEQLRREIHALGLEERVVFVGYVPHPEIPRYLSALDLLVLPSETQPGAKEQFGRVIIEALACGTPVLGSSSGQIPLLIEDTGGGLVFTERDAASCAEQLSRLVSDRELRHRLAKTGRETVLERYTHRALAEPFAETIEQAVASYQVA